MIPGKISLEITYSRSRQNPILKISNFPANSGKVRYPNEKVPSVAHSDFFSGFAIEFQ